MVQDVSNLLPGDPVTVLSPTSQSGGNQFFSNENAMTAPGSEPSSPMLSVSGEELEHAAPKVRVSAPPDVTPEYTTSFESAPVTPTRAHLSSSAPTDYTDPSNGVDAGPNSPHPLMHHAKPIQAPLWEAAGGASGRWKNTPSAGTARNPNAS